MTNPLSVKTKVHVPRSPSALLSAEERTKVFLEVHIQNLTSEPMWFERIIFEPAPEWRVQDANLLPDSQESLFSGTMAMMQAQDTRQYVYILSEVNPPNIPVQHAPGTVLPLGKLDISWRSTFGEPGRLLTSVSRVVIFLAFFSLLPKLKDRCYPAEYLFRQANPSVHHSSSLSSLHLPSRFISSGQQRRSAPRHNRPHARARHHSARRPIVLLRPSATALPLSHLDGIAL